MDKDFTAGIWDTAACCSKHSAQQSVCFWSCFFWCINMFFICAGEGDHLTRVLQRCWRWAKRGHPAPPLILQNSRRGASALGNSRTSVEVWISFLSVSVSVSVSFLGGGRYLLRVFFGYISFAPHLRVPSWSFSGTFESHLLVSSVLHRYPPPSHSHRHYRPTFLTVKYYR